MLKLLINKGCETMTNTQKTTVIIMILGSFLSVLNQTLMNPMLPAVMDDLSINATTAQWLVSGFTLVNAITVALSAFLMDRFKNKSLFIFAFCLFFIGSILAAWAPNFPILLSGRFLQAICAGIMIPMSMTTLLTTFPPEKRGMAMGIYSFVVMFAPSIGPAIAGILTDLVGWHLPFVIIAVLAAIIIGVAFMVMPSDDIIKESKLDYRSVIFIVVGLFAFLYGLSIIAHPETLLFGIISILVGGFLLFIFAKRQLNLKQPFLKVDLLKDVQFRRGVLALMLVSASLTAATITLPLYVQQVRGLSATVSGMIMMPGAIAGAISGFFAGRLADKFGSRILALTGIVFVIIGSVGMAFWGLNTAIAILVIIYCTRYIGLMLANTPINLWSISSLSTDELNHGNALSNTMRQIASTLGTVIMVTIMSLITNLNFHNDTIQNQLTGIHATFYASVIIAAIALFIVYTNIKNKTIDHEVLEKTPLDDVLEKTPSIYDTDTLAHAIDIMLQAKVAGVPVINKDNQLISFISNRDIMRYLSANDIKFINSDLSFIMPDLELFSTKGKELLTKNILDIVSNNSQHINEDMDLSHVCEIFYKDNLEILPVTNNKKYVGTISRMDIMQYFMKQLKT